jgi:hypothetical protein
MAPKATIATAVTSLSPRPSWRFQHDGVTAAAREAHDQGCGRQPSTDPRGCHRDGDGPKRVALSEGRRAQEPWARTPRALVEELEDASVRSGNDDLGALAARATKLPERSRGVGTPLEDLGHECERRGPARARGITSLDDHRRREVDPARLDLRARVREEPGEHTVDDIAPGLGGPRDDDGAIAAIHELDGLSESAFAARG